MTLREQAQAYADLGISVIPVWHGGKRPTRAWEKYQKERPTQAELDMWFGKGGGRSNIAAIGGQVSGNLLVLDFDEAEGYLAWCEAAEMAGLACLGGLGGSLAGAGGPAGPAQPTRPIRPRDLPTYTTGRGYHVWLRTEAPAYTCVAKVEGTDYEVHLRGEGAYAVCPPSSHSNGRHYAWTAKLTEIPVVATVPGLAAVPEVPHAGSNGRPAAVNEAQAEQQEGILPKSAPAQVTFPAWMRELMRQRVTPGGRHDRLLPIAGWARGVLHQRDCLTFMERLNLELCDPPLPAIEVKQMVKSLYAKPGPSIKPFDGGLPDDWGVVVLCSPSGTGPTTNKDEVLVVPPGAVQKHNNTASRGWVQASDIEGMVVPPAQWIVPRILQPGTVTVLVAPSGCIKTWASLWWMRSASRENGLRCLYIDEESGDAEMTRRWNKMGTGGADRSWFWFYSGLSLDIAEHGKALIEAVAEEDIQVVIIDSLRRVLSGDENTSGAVTLMYETLRQLKAMNVAVLVLHHSRKKASGITEGEMGRGSSDVKAMADTYIECYPKSGTRILVKWNKMRCEPAPDPQMLVLREDPDTGQVDLVWTDEEDNDRAAGPPDARILVAVNAEPGLGVRELAVAAQVNIGDCSRLVRALVAERKLAVDKQGTKKAVYPGELFRLPGVGEGEGDVAA